jgi:hypothetical protein
MQERGLQHGQRFETRANQKTTDEIRKLLNDADFDFESVENEALNAYLPKIFQSCPFSEDICLTKQCIECEVFKNSAKR